MDLEGSNSLDHSSGEVRGYPAGSRTTARTNKTTQEPGRSSALFEDKDWPRVAGHLAAASVRTTRIEVGPRQGTTEGEAEGAEEVGGLRSGESRWMPGNRGAWTRRSEGGPCGGEFQEGTLAWALTQDVRSSEFLEVAEAGKRDWRSTAGACGSESPKRKSRMVEISLSGTGEGPGRSQGLGLLDLQD